MTKPTALADRSNNYDKTEMSSLLSNAHGKQRRQERKIQKIDLQKARRYGMEEPSRFGRLKYTYGGVVFIYDPKRRQEVTCFPSSDDASYTSGTIHCEPILLVKKIEFDTKEKKAIHNETRNKIIMENELWRSHSVLVVDMSGSMRRDDVNGARCRSDGVWLSLARDFVRRQLEAGTCSSYDLVSVVIMQDESEILVDREPMDWVLYNDLLDQREWKKLRPGGNGYYMQALKMAEAQLDMNTLGSCSLSLMFFSDGKPSDSEEPFAKRMGSIASRFGRRLTVCCIGMADKDADFSTLENMAAEAKAFGSIASFNKPSLSTDSLSNIIASLVTTLTTTKTEMTDVLTGKAKVVRQDIRRERSNAPDDLTLTSEWDTYCNTGDNEYVNRIWSWCGRKDEFCYIADLRCMACYTTVGNEYFEAELDKGFMCRECKVFFFCNECKDLPFAREHGGSPSCQRWLNYRRGKYVIRKTLPSFSVAVRQSAFGEGAERLVRKMRFLDDNSQFIGPKMVAKESRFLEKTGTYDNRMDYHRQFMRTQALAQRFADEFNGAVDGLDEHVFKDEQSRDEMRRLPRIHFLDPLVVELYEGGKEVNILVEPMLEGKYVKFNNNMGYVAKDDGARSFHSMASDDNAVGFRQQRNAFQEPKFDGLGAIEEGSEEEEEDDEGEDDERDDGIRDSRQKEPEAGSYEDLDAHHFPQAFSHFTYERSKHQFLVVDLQGVLQVKPDGTSCFMLTDPAIHGKKKSRQALAPSNLDLGRTDRGEKGIKAFFQSHKCTDVCRLLGLSEYQE